MPRSSSVLFFAGVFCLFAALLLVANNMDLQSQSVPQTIAAVLLGGGCAVLWAYAGTRKIIWMFFAVAILQIAVNLSINWIGSPHYTLGPRELQQKLHLNGWIEVALIIAGYVLFTLFFQREGGRFFRTQTEVRLAGEIHRSLVPVRHETIGVIELFGASVASSEVGGDLFDIVESDGSWSAYVADVSGHGVAAGILMSMVKSSAYVQLTKLRKPTDLLTDLNDVMQAFTSPANYLTFAYVGGNGGGNLRFALAGHLPILHYQAQSKSIIEHSDNNVPVGLFKNQRFKMSQLSLLPGDLLAIITDGFTEVFDPKEKELGLEEFKSLLLGYAEQPLPEIYRELRGRAMKFGKQTDDQTMLLIRNTFLSGNPGE